MGAIFRTVVFDLDGTLLDTLQDLAAAGEHVCAANGWPPHPVEAYRHFVGNGIPKLIERIAPAWARDPAGLAAARAVFGEYYAAHMLDQTAPCPGIPALLERLHAAGVRMAVLSNKDDVFAREVVGHYFDLSLFAAVRGALPGTPPKPDPAGPRALLMALGASPAETLFVGDSNVDVLTAHNAGAPCCGVLWGFRGQDELTAAGADFIAADAAALARVILGEGRA